MPLCPMPCAICHEIPCLKILTLGRMSDFGLPLLNAQSCTWSRNTANADTCQSGKSMLTSVDQGRPQHFSFWGRALDCLADIM